MTMTITIWTGKPSLGCTPMIEMAMDRCSVCERDPVLCLRSNTSHGEYQEIAICQPCTIQAFRNASFKGVEGFVWLPTNITCVYCGTKLQARQRDEQLRCPGCSVSGLGKCPPGRIVKSEEEADKP